MIINLFSTKKPKSPKRKTRSHSKKKRKSPKRKTRSHSKKKPKSPKKKRKSPKKKRKSPKKKRKSSKRVESTLKKKIKSTEWFIVTMEGCGYCTEAKKILTSNGKKYRSIALTNKNKEEIWDVTDKIIDEKYRYFPMIFHKGKFVGGYGDLKKISFSSC